MLVVGFVVMTLATVMETEAEVIHMGVALQVVILQRVSLQGMTPRLPPEAYVRMSSPNLRENRECLKRIGGCKTTSRLK